MKSNQVKIGIVLSYVSMIVTNLLGLIYTPYMLSQLGSSDYGIYTLAASTVSYLGLLSFGFGSAYMRYYSKYKVNNQYKEIAKLNGMFMSVFCVISLLVIIGGIILTLNVENIFSQKLTSEELNRTKTIMAIMVINLALTFPSSVYGSYVTAHERFLFQRLLSLISSVGNTITMALMLFFGYKAIALSIVTTIWTLVQFFARVYYCNKKLAIHFEFKSFDWKLFRGIGVFSFFIFLNSFIDTINWGIDKFLLGIFQGSFAIAVYGVASNLNTYFLLLSTSISGVFIPRVNTIVATNEEGSDKQLTELMTKVGRLQFMLLSLVYIGFVFFGEPFIELYWGGIEYKDAYYVALILMGSVLLPLCQNVGIEIQRAKNKHQLRSIVYTGLAIANVILSIPLCQCFGAIGCSIGTGLSLVIGNGIIMNLIYHKKLNLNMIYYWKEIIKILPSLIIPIVVCIVCKHFLIINNLFVLLLAIVGFSIVYLLSIWFFAMNTYEKNLFASPIKRIKKRAKLKKHSQQ